MTSKEALESWFNVISTNDKIRWEEHYKVIKKDLEVLEILKDNLFEEKGTGRFKGMNVISCSLGNKHSGEYYYKVKEWLDHD